MMDIIKEIKKLKKEKKAIIMAHNYQRKEVQEIADYLGDSLELARQATKVKAEIIVFAGVYFMAETAKILNPERVVLIPEEEATCAMAKMVDIVELKKLKKQYPDAAVVSYINTTAETKTYTDIVCTSANAVKIVNSLPNKRIIFLPDKNLGEFVSLKTDKEIILYPGFCYVHQQLITEKMILDIKGKYKDGFTMVHPETPQTVQKHADAILSTGQMIKEIGKIKTDNIIVGTEEGMVYRLRRDFPDKNFIPISMDAKCVGMKVITLESIYNSLKFERYKIEIDNKTVEKAKKPILKMLDIK
jgi:quinolinate synthase